MIFARIHWLALAAVTSILSTRGVLAEPITIMTQNMDEGTDYSALVAANSPGAFVAAVTQTYQEIAATQPDARAKVMANEIATQQPDLVALQEASIVRTGITSPATTVTSDLLTSLVNQLAVLGQHYAPVIVGTELDAEARDTRGRRPPDDTGCHPGADRPAQLAIQCIESAGAPVRDTAHRPDCRGANRIDARLGFGGCRLLDGTSFRFVTTHLDTGQFSPSIQLAQAQELLATAGGTLLPIIYTGDFNSSADDPLDPTFPTYKTFIDAGLGDAWTVVNPSDPGFTCCEGSNLLNPDPTLTQRIDLAIYS